MSVDLHDTIDSCGWIDPDGNFFPCNQFDHDLFALQVIEQLGLELPLSHQNCCDVIEKHGFIRVYRDSALERYSVSFSVPANADQLDVIKRIPGKAYELYLDDLNSGIWKN